MNSFPLPSSVALSDIQGCPKATSPPKVTSTFQRRSSRSRYCLTYAEWITRALLSSKDRCACLADIYEWMAFNVPGLQEQRFLHSSKGWKNAVRHTLSINPRFRKLKRFGKPSLWTLSDEYLGQTESLSQLSDAVQAESKTDGHMFMNEEDSMTRKADHSQTNCSPNNYTDSSQSGQLLQWAGLSEPYSQKSILPIVSSPGQLQGANQLPLATGPLAQQQEYQRMLASLATSTAELASQSLPLTAATQPGVGVRSMTQVLQVTTLNGSEASFVLPRPLPMRCLTDQKLFLASLLWPSYPMTAQP